MRNYMRKVGMKVATCMILGCVLLLMTGLEVVAAGKYDAKVYQDILNFPTLYSGELTYGRAGLVFAGNEIYFNQNQNEELEYVIKDISGDGIKELIVCDGIYTFIFTQKYNKNLKRMQASVMGVIEVNYFERICYRKINGKRYLACDLSYTGGGTERKCVFQVKGNKLVLKNDIYYKGAFQSDTTIAYYNNSTEISEKKYNSLLKKYLAKKYSLKSKTKKLSYVETPRKIYTIASKIAPSIVAIGTMGEKNVWSAQSRTFMATYILTRYDADKSKVKLKAVKKEMKHLFGTKKTKFSSTYPFNTMKKSGKWVTRPAVDFGAEYPSYDMPPICKTGKNTYSAVFSSFVEVDYGERIKFKEYVVDFKKSSGKYGYIITDIRLVN